MFRLMEILLYTSDMTRLRAFYERVVGLRYRTASPSWTAYETDGALLALRPLPAGHAPYIELTFATFDLGQAVSALRGRGAAITGEISMHGWGRLARLRDPEGNALAIAQPTQPVEEGSGLTLGAAIVHARDLSAVKSFYHHVMGLRLEMDEPGWAQFDTGVTRLALRPHAERVPGRTLAFGFRIPDLMAWAEEARARGLQFATAPRDEDWGLFSDTVDPDGNRVTFFEPARPLALEEELAEAFEDDGVPRATAIRRSVKKGSKAVSRLVVKPEYVSAPASKPTRRRPSATTRRVSSVRGAGPEHTRLKPKRTADEKKARTKPAIGRLKKAERAVMARKKTAVARASKGKPVKHAAARGGRKR